MGELAHGIEPGVLNRVAAEIAALHAGGVQLGVVIGGGNLYRGAAISAATRFNTPGSMPWANSPINASPLNLSSIRR